MPDVMLNSYMLRETADALFGEDWKERLQPYIDRLSRKSEIIREIASSSSPDADEFLSLFFQARRYRKTAERRDVLNILASLEEEPESIHAEIKGVPLEISRDIICEALHFLHPDRYCLANRWVWNPERGTGALHPFIKTEKCFMIFRERQKVLRNILSSLRLHGYDFENSYPLDVFCALLYSRDVIGAKDISMNAGGMEALFPNNNVISMMILGIRGLELAHP